MNNKIGKFAIQIILISSLFMLSAWENYSSKLIQSKEWKAPISANSLKNPLIGNMVSTLEGKKLYKKMCAICHGNSGKGDGMAGISLNPRPTNLTTEKVQRQSDGAIYWKMTEGLAPMASYKKILKDEQRWQLVNYIRTFKKQ